MHRVVWLAAIAVFGTASWAVDSEEPGAAQSARITELETVTVTATKIERSAYEVPGSVSHPPWGLIAGARGRFVQRQDRVSAGVPETPGYGVYDLYASWLPDAATLSGLRIDFGVDNLSDKSYRRHLALIDEAGRSFKVSASYQF